MPLDGYEQSANVYVDSLGNQLTYFNWRSGEPNGPMTEPYLEILNNKMNDRGLFNDPSSNVVCVKCSGYYSVPNGYECHDSDFGTVVVKAYTESSSPTAARDQCSKDANYLHLPTPTSDTENQWYWAYSQHVGLPGYWLGISDVAVEGQWRTNNGDLQTYFNWSPGQPDNAAGIQDYAYSGGCCGPNGKWDDGQLDLGNLHALCTYTIPGTAP